MFFRFLLVFIFCFPFLLLSEEAEMVLPFPVLSPKEVSEVPLEDPKPLAVLPPIEKDTKEPNAVPPKKKKKKADVDPSLGPYLRGKAYLSRRKKKEAEEEFAKASSQEGENSQKSKIDSASLLGEDKKQSEASGIVDKLEDPEGKTKAQYELAKSLDQIGSDDSQEKAYQEYLKLVTAFPPHPELTPRSHLAIAIHLIRRKEYRPALHHTTKIIQDYPEFSDRPLGYYYTGRIYEAASEEQNLGRAKKYYDLYLNAVKDQKLPLGKDFRRDAEKRSSKLATERVL